MDSKYSSTEMSTHKKESDAIEEMDDYLFSML